MGNGRDPNDPFEWVTVYVPRGTQAILKRMAEEKGLPVSRLIMYAVDNEMDAPNPFSFPTELPTTPYIQYAYTEEAQKIYRLLFKFRTGVGRDMLMLCRRDAGLPNRDVFLAALRELLMLKLVEEGKPNTRKSKFKGYKEGYKFIRFAKDVEAIHKEEQDEPDSTKSVLDEA